MDKGKTRFLIPFAVVAMLLTALVAPAAATTIGDDEGCTPGFWKNHVEDWEEYSPDDLFGDVFGVEYDKEFIDALQGGGGKGIAGAQKILARAATAALLNAAHESLGYPLRRHPYWSDGEHHDGIFIWVQDAWASGKRRKMLRLASWLDDINNMHCPL